MRALTDFLLRESLALLLDDPTPRSVAQAMGGAYAADAAALESQTDASEDSESQGFAAFAATTHRVMMVRSTNSAQQLVTLVDRHFSIDAFLPQALIDELRVTRRYQSISRLRGSVVRIVKYHFATPAQCRATQSQQQPTSVSTRQAHRERALLCLFVDGLAVIDDGELAVNPMPELEEHPAVAKQLAALSPTALEQRLALRQVLDVAASSSPVEPVVAPSPAKRFDARNPLLDEDVEIPKDQERALDAQEGWGEPEPTDSQLIAENGPVSGSGESQPVSSSGTSIVSSSSNTVVSSSSDATSPDGRLRVVVPETEPQTTSPVLQEPPQASGDGSVPDSQDFHFQQVNLKKAFVECSDTDSDNEEYEKGGATVAPKPTTAPSQSQEPNAETPPQAEATGSPSIQSTDGDEQPPRTQADAASTEAAIAADVAEDVAPSQPAGEFVGVVRLDHDEPMTQMGDETQVESQDPLPSIEWHRQAPDPTPSFDAPSDQETIDVEYEFGGQDATEQQEQTEERPSASQQDGQADHWMDTEPTDTTAQRSETPSREAASPGDGLNVTQRRKRRRTSAGAIASQPLSPQEPTAKAARVAVVPATTATARATTFTPDPNMFTSFLASTETTNAPLAMGISAFNTKTTNQRLRPSKRFEHLLPPFDFDAIRHQIRDKKD